MPKLFEPLQLGGLCLPNRIIVSPMCQYSAQEGDANDWHAAHLASLALSGAGLVFVEATAVTRQGRITPGCLGLWSDANEAALGAVLARVRAVAPTPLGIQLAHAGRKGSSLVPWHGGQHMALAAGGWRPVAPSEVPHATHEPAPHALTTGEIADIVAAFEEAARRAVRLGFEAIEVHAAHGYLLHQFLSPLANHRDDAYGGSFENRIRIVLEVFERVRRAVPQTIPVGVRVSATDWLEFKDVPSWRLEDSIALAHALKERGCAWIDASSAGISPEQKIDLKPGYQVPFARAIRSATGIATFAVGLITEPEQAEGILAAGDADAVALARAMLYDPRWGWHAAAALGGTVFGPQPYWRALPKEAGRIFGDTPIGMR